MIIQFIYDDGRKRSFSFETPILDITFKIPKLFRSNYDKKLEKSICKIFNTTRNKDLKEYFYCKYYMIKLKNGFVDFINISDEYNEDFIDKVIKFLKENANSHCGVIIKNTKQEYVDKIKEELKNNIDYCM